MSDNSVVALSEESQPSKALNVKLWVLQALAAAAFLMAGGTKLAGAVATHLFIIGGSPLPAIMLLLITAAVAWYRRPESLR